MKTPSSINSLKTALFALLLLSASCTKNGDSIAPAEPTLPCAGRNLRMTALTTDPLVDFDGDGNVDKDVLAFLPACSRDNTINFEKNGTLSGSDGADKCPASDDDEPIGNAKPGVWTYDQQIKKIHIVYNGDTKDAIDWDVVSVSASTLKARVRLVSEANNTLDLVMTWQAQ